MQAYTFSQFKEIISSIACPQGHKKLIRIPITEVKTRHLCKNFDATVVENVETCARWISTKKCLAIGPEKEHLLYQISDTTVAVQGIPFQFVKVEPTASFKAIVPVNSSYTLFDDIFYIWTTHIDGKEESCAVFLFDELRDEHLSLLRFVAGIEIPFVSDDNRCIEDFVKTIFELAPLRRPRAPLKADLGSEDLAKYVVTRKDDGVRAYLVIRGPFVFLLTDVATSVPHARLILILSPENSVNYETLIIDGELEESYVGVTSAYHLTVSEVVYYNGLTEIPRKDMGKIVKELCLGVNSRITLQSKWHLPYGPNVVGGLIEYARDFPDNLEGLILTPQDVSSDLPVLKWKNCVTYDFQVRQQKLMTSAGTQFFKYSLNTKEYNGSIVECSYDPSRNVFNVIRERPDKTFPNSARVLLANMRADARDILDESEKLVLTRPFVPKTRILPVQFIMNDPGLVVDLDGFVLLDHTMSEETIAEGCIDHCQEKISSVVTKCRLIVYAFSHALVQDLCPSERRLDKKNALKHIRAFFKKAADQSMAPENCVIYTRR